MSNSTNLIALSAPVAIQAAAGGDKKSPAKFTSTFYTGGALDISGWSLPVVVDLAGLANGNTLVANLDHDASKRVGNFSVQNDGKSLVAHGTATAATAARDEVVQSAADGYQWQASLEVTPTRVDEIKPGERVDVNGQSFVGPIYVTRAGVLKGFAFVSHGADDNTTATITARLKMQPEVKDWAMKMGLNVDSLSANQIATIEANYNGFSQPAVTQRKELVMEGISAEARRAFLTADRQRQDAINAACAAFTGPTLKDQAEALRVRAIESDMSVADVKAALFDLHERESRITTSESRAPLGFSVVASGSSAVRSSPDVLTASLLCRTGRDELAVQSYGEQVVHAAKRLRGNSLVDLCQAACTMQGVDTGGMNRNEMIRAAFSTFSLTTALSNATGKALWAAYMEAPSSWRRFAKVLPAANFKTQTGVRPSFVGNMEKVSPAGEIKHGQVAESTYTWSINTFAKQLRVTRTDIINDDLGFFDQTAPNMARMAARGVSDLVWQTILTNGGSFFHADHANLLTSGSSALDATSLALGIRKMRQQRSAAPNYDDLDIQPIVLVVPPELEQTGKGLLNSEYIQQLASATGPTGNPLKAALSLEVEARISNTSKFTGATATQWYLYASPADAPVVVGFLDGQQTPTAEFFGLSSEIDTLGVAWRIVHDYGCALADYRAAVKSDGA